jgi:RHH-type proline utilization regulon transcriptional repressor/proline dehydrogenase/delta 1-pyrroline-5-carboxylate dehydrogenase
MRARNLDEAILLVNATGYGLTSGLESLDDREQERWRGAIRAGNLYINRPTTGAIVLRQPFGGVGKSAFGPGIKAGGPNYVAQFMRFVDRAVPSTEYPVPSILPSPQLVDLRESLTNLLLFPEKYPGVDRVIAAVDSYAAAYHDEFQPEHDTFRLVGQDNLRRYLKVGDMRIRLTVADSLFETLARVAAARTVGCRITVSVPTGFTSPARELLERLTDAWAGAIEFVEESDDRLCEVIRRHQTDRVRYAAADRVPLAVRSAAADAIVYIADAPVLASGRMELLWYVQEQSISFNYHRYGNLGARGEERRADTW